MTQLFIVNIMNINSSIVSKHRPALMGIAILWVILYHMVAKGTEYFDFKFLNALFNQGDSGVDIFLFLSGWGCYFSYKKYSILEFYKRRLIRIIPLYIIICLVYIFAINGDLIDFFSCISTFGFWSRGVWYDWYIPGILLFYLLYPLIGKSAKKFGILPLIISTIVCTGIIFYFQISTNYQFGDIRMFVLSRFPVFMLGAYWGYLQFEKKEKSGYAFCFTVSGILGFVFFLWFMIHTHFLLFSGVRQLLHIIFAPGMCFLFSYILEVFDKHINVINRILSFFGSMSLELYLIHVKFFGIMPFFNADYKVIYGLSIIAATFILAYPTHILLGKLNRIIL